MIRRWSEVRRISLFAILISAVTYRPAEHPENLRSFRSAPNPSIPMLFKEIMCFGKYAKYPSVFP